MAKLNDVADFYIALAQEMAEAGLGDGMTNLRLQKMLYFSQGWSLARNGKPLFSEPIEAWQYGPVIPPCYRWYKGFGSSPLTAAMPPREAFSDEEYELLLDVWNELSKHSTAQLVTMTHAKGTPWDIAWNHSSSREMTNESICRYFSGIKLSSMKDALSRIPVVKPLYYKDGVPVFAAEDNCQYEQS